GAAHYFQVVGEDGKARIIQCAFGQPAIIVNGSGEFRRSGLHCSLIEGHRSKRIPEDTTEQRALPCLFSSLALLEGRLRICHLLTIHSKKFFGIIKTGQLILRRGSGKRPGLYRSLGCTDCVIKSTRGPGESMERRHDAVSNMPSNYKGHTI